MRKNGRQDEKNTSWRFFMGSIQHQSHRVRTVEIEIGTSGNKKNIQFWLNSLFWEEISIKIILQNWDFSFFLSRCHLFLLLRGQIVIRLMATIYYAHFKKEIRSLGVSGQFWWLFEKFGTKIKSLHKSKDLNNFPNIPPFLSL